MRSTIDDDLIPPVRCPVAAAASPAFAFVAWLARSCELARKSVAHDLARTLILACSISDDRRLRRQVAAGVLLLARGGKTLPDGCVFAAGHP